MILLFCLLLQEERVESLIEKLGSDSVQERERAGERLRERAGEAERALEGAARSADAEVAARAGEILEVLVGYRQEAARTLALIMEDARFEFDRGHFLHAARLCDRALGLAPRLDPAEDLKRSALAGCWRPDSGPALQPADLRSLRLPSLDAWRASTAPRAAPVEEEEPPCIQRKLATMKIDLAFEETALEDILAFIRDFSGLNIVLDVSLRTSIDPAQKMDLKVKDRTVGQVLRCLLSELGLTYVITAERVVLLTR